MARRELADHDDARQWSVSKLWRAHLASKKPRQNKLSKRARRAYVGRASSRGIFRHGLEARATSGAEVRSTYAFATPKELAVDRAARGETAGDLPKSCHLLPSAAILEPQNRYVRFNRSIPFLAPRGYAGQPVVGH
jgi:hypothetical protein